nr:triple gene block protein 2 [Banmivirus BanMMV]WAB21388.1 triple gene block protein 2 [Banmivirus BanMMV]
MNNSVEKLKQLILGSGFLATGLPISDKIVIHGVAGCGKSTLTEELLKDSNFNIVNTLASCNPNLEGQFIRRDLTTFEDKINILDEYLSVSHHEGFQVLLADPFQYKKIPYPAHYIKRESHRFRKELIPILAEIGIEVETEESGLKVIRGSAYEIEPKGKIISIEAEVIKYILKHGLEAYHSTCVQGQEFESVTFYHSKEFKDLERSDLYVALTRVKRELRILQL